MGALEWVYRVSGFFGVQRCLSFFIACDCTRRLVSFRFHPCRVSVFISGTFLRQRVYVPANKRNKDSGSKKRVNHARRHLLLFHTPILRVLARMTTQTVDNVYLQKWYDICIFVTLHRCCRTAPEALVCRTYGSSRTAEKRNNNRGVL